MLNARDEEGARRCARQLASISASGAARLANSLARLAGERTIERRAFDELLHWAHAAVRGRVVEDLLGVGALRARGLSYDIEQDLLEAIRLMLGAIAPYAVEREATYPAVYISPPDLLPVLPGEVGEIRQLLIALVAGARERISIITPFYSEAAFHEILAPLERPGIGAALALYLSLDRADLGRGASLLRTVRERFPSHDVRGYLHARPRTGSTALPHAKLLLADSSAGYLGSANVSLHGLHEQFEAGVRLDARAVRTLEQALDALVARGLYVPWEQSEDSAPPM